MLINRMPRLQLEPRLKSLSYQQSRKESLGSDVADLKFWLLFLSNVLFKDTKCKAGFPSSAGGSEESTQNTFRSEPINSLVNSDMKLRSVQTHLCSDVVKN